MGVADEGKEVEDERVVDNWTFPKLKERRVLVDEREGEGKEEKYLVRNNDN